MTEDLPDSDQPSVPLFDENIIKMTEMMMKNHHSSLRKMTQDLDMSHSKGAKFPHQSHSKMKVMLSGFFNYHPLRILFK